MTDIAKCEGKIITKEDELKVCERRKSCYRYQTSSSQMQSFIRPTQINGECPYYWNIHG